ncbi:unnamed protein product [Schistosoma margrebowiei]|uniref:Uncharacterized protein n=1 Tax=Schistosoma margrebowiei TaxID=48269 RepID=A0AA85AMD2_9TREM|nr:unnamed protein product [Schistosoma margrebowiei]
MPIMSLRHVSPRSKAPPPPLQQSNSISSERDYNYHTKHSYDLYNTTSNTTNNTTHYYLIDKPYKHNKSKSNNVYLSHNKLFDILNVTNDRRNHQFLKQTTSKLDTSIDTYSIPSKLRTMQNYGASVSSVNNCTINTTTTTATTTTITTTTNNSNNMSKESFENSNLKNRYSKSIHCQSPIIHVRNNIHNISNHSNNNNNNTINHNRLNDGFNFLKHINKSKKYLNTRQYSINNSYDDVINLNKLTDSNHYLLSVSELVRYMIKWLLSV